MPTTDDLRATLQELARSARDVPDMPLTRAAPPRRAASATRPAVLVAGLLVVLLGVGLVVSRPDLLPLPPATGPTRAVPPAASPAPSTATSPTPTPTPAGRPGPGTRPMTRAEIGTRTAACLETLEGSEEYRRGELEVRYAMLQPAVGHPRNTSPRPALLLEDDDWYYDCSGEYGTATAKGGDDVDVDRSAAGVELPTISGSSSARCNGAREDATIDSAVALTTSRRARTARVTLTTARGSRTTTLPTRDGHVYVAVRVSGDAAWKPSTFTLELVDGRGRRLPVQPYAATATDRLSYPLGPCARRGG